MQATVKINLHDEEPFLSSENLAHVDAIVMEIFKVMFGYDIETLKMPGNDSAVPGHDDRTAIVGFSGAMRGSCQIRVSTEAAQSIASAMLGGVPIDAEDDSINDALGELCNMLAGGWKNGVPELSSECALSPPTVISGRDYKVHVTRPSAQLVRTYQFAHHLLHLTLCREEHENPEMS